MSTAQERQKALVDILDQLVLVIDGAMGTMIDQAPLSLETNSFGSTQMTPAENQLDDRTYEWNYAAAKAAREAACPNLDDQQGIWKLIHPEEIGVHLTEGMMMEPYFTADEA